MLQRIAYLSTLMPSTFCSPCSTRARLGLLAGLASLAAGSALAQITPVPRGGDAIAHRIVAGDTLEHLAARYLGDHRQWTALQSHNHVANPYRLRPGSILEIPTRLLRAAAASVEFVQGEVRATRLLSHLGDGREQPLPAVQKGQLLQEGDALKLAPDAFVSVRLADGSLVRVQAASDIQLRQMRRKGRAGSLQSVLDLREGGLEASVPQQAGGGERRFEVRTPAASTSVRGTRFLVQASAQGQTAAAVDEGLVAVQAGVPATLLHPGQGVAVSGQGQLGRPQHMLPAPDISAWPSLAEDANWVSLPLPALPGAERYQIQLALDRDLTQVVRSGSFAQSPLRLAGVDDGDYVVAIRGVDANGIPGARSLQALRVKAHPVPPLYESPAQDAVVGLGQGSLQCTRVTQATAYRIQIADGAAGFDRPVLDRADLEECLLPASAMAQLPPGRYQWRAASIRRLANGQPDQGPFASAQGFALAPVPPAPAADALQLGDGQGEGSRTIRWGAEPGHRYHIVVASEASFAAPLVDVWLEQAQWSTQELPAGSYYLQMQVQDDNGLVSGFSAARQFRTGSWVTDGSGQMLTSGSGERLQRQ